MNTLIIDELKNLVEAKTGPFITIALPTQRSGAETRQNVIRFKKLLRDAEDQLRAAGLRTADVQQILEPARKLLDDTPFWQHQEEGLAVLISPKLFRTYKLPVASEEQVIVGDSFHIKPILHLLSGDRRFYILALSQNQVRLLDAGLSGAHEIELKDAPESLDDASNVDPQPRQIQIRTLTSNRPGKGDAVSYGLGAPADLTRERLLRYFQMVDAAVSKALKARPGGRAPLVFAGVDYLFPIYKEVNTYTPLMETAITGSPDDLGADDLHRRALSIVQPMFEKARLASTEYYRQIANTPRTSHKIGQVAPAAYHGRVDVLFIQKDVQAWGAYAPEVGAVHEYGAPQPGSMDMFDFAAAHTLMHGGTVYVVDRPLMPNGSSVAAILRY